MTHAVKGFATQTNELTIERLPIHGSIPTWVNGQLLRNGPAIFDVGADTYNHWFDGLAMLHRFGFADGNVSYSNKLLRSEGYEAAHAQGKISRTEFATDPCRSIFKRFATLFVEGDASNNTNVNVARLADRYVAMTETPIPVEFDPITLETVGVYDYAGDVDGQMTTAHPHHDFATGQTFNFVSKFGRVPSYNIYSIGHDGRTRTLIASLPIDEIAYMHSFAVTKTYIILAEFPVTVRPLDLLLKGKTFAENLVWRTERPMKFRLIRRNTGVLEHTIEAPQRFSFHHVNAFERDNAVIVDMVTYPDSRLIDQLYLASLRDPFHGAYNGGQLERFILPLDGSPVTSEVLSQECYELPRINYHHANMNDYRYAYGISNHQRIPDNHANQLVKTDVQHGVDHVWHEPKCYPGEPVFVSAPNATNEDDGVILSVVLDGEAGNSFLLVLDAATMQEIGRATVPQHIPFGFHGMYYS